MDLTTGPLIPKIITYTIPIILTGVLQLMFNAADLIVVGQFAENNQTKPLMIYYLVDILVFLLGTLDFITQ